MDKEARRKKWSNYIRRKKMDGCLLFTVRWTTDLAVFLMGHLMLLSLTQERNLTFYLFLLLWKFLSSAVSKAASAWVAEDQTKKSISV